MKIISKILTTFQSKPLNKKATTPFFRKEVEQDCLELSTQALEKKLINEVWQYGNKHNLETAKIIDKNGKLLNMTMEETPLGINFPNQSFLDMFFAFENSNFIHNHTFELPLSFVDINTLLNMQIHKMTAVTPKGKISSLVFPKNKMIRIEDGVVVSPKNSFEMSTDVAKLSNEEINYLKHLKLFDENEQKFLSNFRSAPEDIIKKLYNWRNSKIQDFADKFGLEYKIEHL